MSAVHWLLFNEAREVVGCHCGFVADESDEGWGDSVVEHLLAADDGVPHANPFNVPHEITHTA